MKAVHGLLAAAIGVAVAGAATAGGPFEGWNAQTHAALIARDGSLAELSAPGTAPRALVADGGIELAGWAPRKGDVAVAAKQGQIYAVADGHLTLLSDGKGRKTLNAWSHDGHWVAYLADGPDEALHVVDPRDPKSDRLVVQFKGSGWALLDFTADGTSAVVAHRLAGAQVALFFMDIASGAMRPIGKPAAYGDARFSYDGVLWATLAGRLGMIDEGGGVFTPVAPDRAGVTGFEVSLDGKLVAYVAGGALKLLDTRSGQARVVPGMPADAIDDLHFAPAGLLGFSAGGQVYALDTATMAVTRWGA